MEGAKCNKCHRLVVMTADYAYRCQKCKLALCRDCDDKSQTLTWWGHEVDITDEYLCKPCITKKKKALQKQKDKDAKDALSEMTKKIEADKNGLVSIPKQADTDESDGDA